MFANDLRGYFPDVKDDYDVNTIAGTVECTRAYEQVGMIHILVGNSCPGVFKKNKELLRVATHGNAGGLKRVGGICTDLWWFSGGKF